MNASYETVIGLEVHAQLRTHSKLFCGCSTQFGAPPNAHTCPTCLGLPGSLPVPNAAAIELAMRAALAVGCEVRERSVFERKNYFYPDLAKGYQISQYALPLNVAGKLEVETEAGGRRVIGITRIHLEEDAAKNLHSSAAAQTLVDFNRAGVALIEIVSEPDLRSSAEAEQYLRNLREILMAVGVNDGNLEEGSFRCDANVSIRAPGATELGTRTELKNINSFRFVRKAIDYEAARHHAVIAGGGKIVQETRLWDDAQGKTVPMRSKEEAMDYRYFPDPDLPPIVVSAAQIEAAAGVLPELPATKRARYVAELGLTAADAGVLTSHPALSGFFEATVEELSSRLGGRIEPARAGKRAANFIQAEVLRDFSADGLEASLPLSAAALSELLALLEAGSISGKMAKGVLAEMIASGKPAAKIVEEQGLSQVSDSALIEEVVRKVVDGSPDNVAAYRAGKQNVVGWFVGQVMKETRGQANPRMVNELLRKLLEGE
ncbi:MAG: Asp-tRNA(Asn)/Glu-tRNA(Gln) amidotransferase subunit GatB [Myxococcales bacterium]|nr:Asp-tRNA(Asn)/Glu-tRNA(Gln) amidotransferase subunit GatB [Myxococcales bacterium]